jgi:NADH dehydrogenase [ubiquinone] 1 alpha subcomplex assembly factor 5
VNNLPKLFKETIRCLKPDCAFIGSMFAGDTLFELRVAMQLAELERKGGITSRISPFTTPQDVGGLLNSSGYKLLTIDFDEICISYPSIFELMYDVKGKTFNIIQAYFSFLISVFELKA